MVPNVYAAHPTAAIYKKPLSPGIDLERFCDRLSDLFKKNSNSIQKISNSIQKISNSIQKISNSIQDFSNSIQDLFHNSPKIICPNFHQNSHN